MKIIVPPIVRALSLADYAPELKPAEGPAPAVYVWVNPTRAVLDEYTVLQARNTEVNERLKAVATKDEIAPLVDEMNAVGDGFTAWYANVWSQHADAATHWTPAEVNVLVSDEANPGLYRWLTRQTWRLIREYRAAEKKS